jgi:hypothetical protein
MRHNPHKLASLSAAVVYSLLFHTVVLGAVLTSPIYREGEHIESYLIYLQGEGEQVNVPAPSEVRDAGGVKSENKPLTPVVKKAMPRRADLKQSVKVRTPDKQSPKTKKPVIEKTAGNKKIFSRVYEIKKPVVLDRPAPAKVKKPVVLDRPAPAKEIQPEKHELKVREQKVDEVVPEALSEEVKDDALKETEKTAALKVEKQPEELYDKLGWEEPLKIMEEPLPGGIDVDEEEVEVEAEAEKERHPALLEEFCVDCDLVSLLHENPAEEILYEAEHEEEPFADENTEYAVVAAEQQSLLDELCWLCDMVSRLFENPATEILYGDAEPEEEFPPAKDEGPEEILLADAAGSLAGVIPEPVVFRMPMVDLGLDIPDARVQWPEYTVIDDSEDESLVAEILTPQNNRTPSREDYMPIIEDIVDETPEPESAPLAKAEIGLPVYLPMDIEVEVFLEGEETGVSFRLLRKAHPMAGGKGEKGQADLADELEKRSIVGSASLKEVFSLARASKGVYSFIVESDRWDVRYVDLTFRLYGGRSSEKLKEYKRVEVGRELPSLEVKFIMPEAVFWDDEDYFTGTIEGPSAVTKFNDETGLIWKEKTAY